MTQPLRENATRRPSSSRPPGMEAADLERTLRKAATGDEVAWRRLVEAYSGRVYGLLCRQTGDRELAEELTQATFVKLVTKLADFSGYREQGRFEPWLLRVAMNGLRDEMRRRKRQATPMDMGPSAGSGREETDGGWAMAQQRVVMGGAENSGATGEDPSQVVSRGEQVERLRLALAKLNEADQRVLHLRHTAGLSFAKVAETLDQPLGTVLARAHRALNKLRKLMEEPDAQDRKPVPEPASAGAGNRAAEHHGGDKPKGKSRAAKPA